MEQTFIRIYSLRSCLVNLMQFDKLRRQSFDCNPIKTFFQIAECESPLGLQSGDIPDSDITASSEVRNLTKLEAFNFSERVFFLQLRETRKKIFTGPTTGVQPREISLLDSYTLFPNKVCASTPHFLIQNVSKFSRQNA